MIDSFRQVQLGGLTQSILVRGRSLDNPLLLFLHGGPGFPFIPFANNFPHQLEEDYTVVHWDQRGTGKSFSKGISPATMTLEQMLSDAHELVSFLKKQYCKEKIYLAGHSWGTILGTHLLFAHPEDFCGYIGIAQAVHYDRSTALCYELALKAAKTAGDTEIERELGQIGRPPYDDNEKVSILIANVERLGGSLHNQRISFAQMISQSDLYTQSEKANIGHGLGFSCALLWHEVMRVRFIDTHRHFPVPVYLLSGSHDFIAPYSLVDEYFAKLDAPEKKIFLFEESGHFPFFEEPERFYEVLHNICHW